MYIGRLRMYNLKFACGAQHITQQQKGKQEQQEVGERAGSNRSASHTQPLHPIA